MGLASKMAAAQQAQGGAPPGLQAGQPPYPTGGQPQYGQGQQGQISSPVHPSPSPHPSPTPTAGGAGRGRRGAGAGRGRGRTPPRADLLQADARACRTTGVCPIASKQQGGVTWLSPSFFEPGQFFSEPGQLFFEPGQFFFEPVLARAAAAQARPVFSWGMPYMQGVLGG